jgi:hypothetical protein
MLNPEFDIKGQRVLMLTQQLAGVAAERLKAPVPHLGDRVHDILQALNFLFSGVQHCPS